MSTSRESLVIGNGGSRVSAEYARPDATTATIVVAHGAGSGMEHPFLVGFTAALNNLGVATLRFNFAYREAGRRLPGPAPAAVGTWRSVMAEAERRSGGEPVWAAGKSYGGRMASMAVSEGMPADGLVFLGYPLHPPGKPDALRDAHLYGIGVPMLFLQGENDPFATAGLLDVVVARIGSTATLDWIEGGDHSFAVKGVKRGATEVGASLAERVARFVSAN